MTIPLASQQGEPLPRDDAASPPLPAWLDRAAQAGAEGSELSQPETAEPQAHPEPPPESGSLQNAASPQPSADLDLLWLRGFLRQHPASPRPEMPEQSAAAGEDLTRPEDVPPSEARSSPPEQPLDENPAAAATQDTAPPEPSLSKPSPSASSPPEPSPPEPSWLESLGPESLRPESSPQPRYMRAQRKAPQQEWPRRAPQSSAAPIQPETSAPSRTLAAESRNGVGTRPAPAPARGWGRRPALGTALAGFAAVALVALAGWAWTSQKSSDVVRQDRLVERRALENRLSVLAGHAFAPGSALGCLDRPQGETLDAGCEAALFASPAAATAALAYTEARLNLLADGLAYARAHDPRFEPSLAPLRAALEQDRFGTVSHVLMARRGCAPADCRAFEMFGDATRLRANMRDAAFPVHLARAAAGWNKNEPPPPMVANAYPGADRSALSGQDLPSRPPPYKPLPPDYDLPSSDSIPPISIMDPEPGMAPSGNPSPPPRPRAASEQRPQPAAPAPAR